MTKLMKLCFMKGIIENRKLRDSVCLKLLIDVFSLICKYIILVGLFNQALQILESSKEFESFFFVVFINCCCVILRIVLQNTGQQYLNPAVKLHIDEFFVTKFLSESRFDAVLGNEQSCQQKEFNINFLKTNIYTVIDNMCIIVAHLAVLILNIIYLAKFHLLYFLVGIFPVLNIYVNKKIAALEIAINEKETGILQTQRELVKITDNEDALNYVRSSSLFDKFIIYSQKAYLKCINDTSRNRKLVAMLYWLSSILRICAVFFTAVGLSVHLVKLEEIMVADVVVIITACNMTASSVSSIVLKSVKSRELLQKLNSIFEESKDQHILHIEEKITEIQMRHVTYAYLTGDIELQYDFNVSAGEKLVLTGGNGCGKSTLLKLMSGYLKPSSGEIFINGKKVDGAYRIDDEISVFEPYPVLGGTIKQYMECSADNSLMSEEEVALLNELGITSDMDLKYGKSISSGSKQVINLIRVLHSNKSLILLDEPTSKINKQLAVFLIRKIMNMDAIVLIATHDPEIINLFDARYIINLKAK